MYNEDPPLRKCQYHRNEVGDGNVCLPFLIAWPMIQLTLGGELTFVRRSEQSASSAGHHQFSQQLSFILRCAFECSLSERCDVL